MKPICSMIERSSTLSSLITSFGISLLEPLITHMHRLQLIYIALSQKLDAMLMNTSQCELSRDNKWFTSQSPLLWSFLIDLARILWLSKWNICRTDILSQNHQEVGIKPLYLSLQRSIAASACLKFCSMFVLPRQTLSHMCIISA